MILPSFPFDCLLVFLGMEGREAIFSLSRDEPPLITSLGGFFPFTWKENEAFLPSLLDPLFFCESMGIFPYDLQY